MKVFLISFTCCLIVYLVFMDFISARPPMAKVWKLPVETVDRRDWSTINFERDAHFNALRAPFGPVKQHYHTGVDIQNGNLDPAGETVYAIAAGKVIAIEDPPPQRRITIEHILPNRTKVWSVYVHIIEAQVKIGDRVESETVIARLMNQAELEAYGWEYHHVHLEILKKSPLPATEFYYRKTFTCYTAEQVDEYFYDPVVFLNHYFRP